MGKISQKGPIISGEHSTLTDIAKIVVNECLMKDAHTIRIAPGFISKTKHSAHGKFRVKCTKINGGILLQIRSNFYIQDVRVYTENSEETQKNVTLFVLSKGYILC